MHAAKRALLVIAAALLTYAAGHPPGPGAAAAGVTAGPRDVVNRFFELAEKKDWPGIGDLLADDFRIYSDGAESFDKVRYLAILKEDDLEVKAWRLGDLEVMASDDGRLAWCRYRGHFDHGASGKVETLETLVLRKDAHGRWKICHCHASIKGRADRDAATPAPR